MASQQEVADLLVRIEASTSALRLELNKADTAVGQTQRTIQQKLSGIDSAFNKLGSGLKGALLAAIPAVTLAGLANLVRSSLEAAGGLGELAQQLGISTDLLQTLQYAGTQAGVSVEEINTGVARLTKTIGDASEGNKTAIDRFNALGVSILDSAGNLRSTDAILRDVADALARIQDPAKRAAAEVDLFGKAGQKLDTIFASGSAAIDDFRKAAEAAGDVLTKDQIDAADKAADKIAALEFQYKKLAQTLSIDLAPAITSVLGGLDDLLHDRPIPAWMQIILRLNPATNTVLTLKDLLDAGPIDQQISETEKKLADLQQKMRDALTLPEGTVSEGAFADLQQQIDATTAKLQNLRDIARPASSFEKPGHGGRTIATLDAAGGGSNPLPTSTGVDKVQKTAAALELQIANLGRSSREQAIYNAVTQAGVDIDTAAGQKIAALADTLFTLTSARERQTATIQASTAAAVAEEEAQRQANERGQRLIAQRQQVTTSIEQEIADNKLLIAAKGESNEAYQKEALFLDLVNRYRATGLPLTDDEVEKARTLSDTLYEQQKALGDNNELANQLGQTFSSAFEDAVVSGSSLSDVLQGLLQDLERIALRAATQPIFNAIFSSLSSLALTALADGGVMTGRGPVPLRRYSSGGVARTAQLALHGEGSTPEAYVPLPDGRSIPVMLRGAGGGGSSQTVVINQEINVNGGGGTPAQNTDLAEKLGAELKRQMQVVAAQEIRTAMRPGGMLNTGM
ncbi:hypothetical protein FRZ44_37920 [Hypericibacter terrae]|uniref:Phage tail tape measure protein domain-containing protein n=1 Tax=Hypericibacter terrae TaxID=2602015 RepID=A0A5J6MPD2_9PROT|nr:phage tail tape measure protein [Hypericibacter terrae]QEX18485.1 hypothetical protein FRZ44_37920 [Hypericibacter terrae]